jgi:hypothetical protein
MLIFTLPDSYNYRLLGDISFLLSLCGFYAERCKNLKVSYPVKLGSRADALFLLFATAFSILLALSSLIGSVARKNARISFPSPLVTLSEIRVLMSSEKDIPFFIRNNWA